MGGRGHLFGLRVGGCGDWLISEVSVTSDRVRLMESRAVLE